MCKGKLLFLKKLIALLLVLLMSMGVLTIPNKFVQAATADPRIRVDITPNTGGRTDMYTQFWNNWIVTSGTSASAAYNGVTFTLSNGGSTGTGIKSGWFKGLVQSSLDSPFLTMDGVIIDGATSGGTIKLEISGLSAGTHTIATWHSFFDIVSGSTMSLTIDGTVKATGIKGPTRVTNDDDAGRAYASFTATAGQSVVVLVKPEGNGTYNNAVLNAFEIDGANPIKSIQKPKPADGDEHLLQEKGLSWTSGEGATSHDIYLGTDYNSVYAADTSSPLFKGNQTGTSYALSGLSHMNTYYWRVDERSSSGITKGAVRSFRIAHLAFPGAEGYGRFARGGRGGRVIEVTNLNDSGAGSLRQAIEVEKGPRVIVFRVGGVIPLQSKLIIPADGGDVYVAGQTAPGDGITVTQYAFGLLGCSDVIIRDVRCRVGDYDGASMDGMGMASANNSIIDHCSISWSIDEGTSSRGAHNITFQRNIIAEALNNSVHYNDTTGDHSGTQRHSFAASISGNIGSFHHNLLTNCTGRNWSLAGGMEQDAIHYAGYLDITNNVIYNWKDRTTDGGVRRVNFVNNYYKMGPVSQNMNIFSIDGDQLGTGDMQMAYLSGNKMVTSTGSTILDPNTDNWTKAGSQYSTVAQVKSNTAFFPSYVTTQTADAAYQSVLNDVGATKPKRDYLDQRYINEVSNGAYTYVGSVDGLKGIIDSQNDVGGYPKLQGGTAPVDTDHDGMPDAWETNHGLNPNNDSDRNDLQLSTDGYTNLEMYLDELAGDPVNYRSNAINATSSIEAESYSSVSGVNIETCSEGGQDIGYIENGDYIEFDNVDFGTGVNSFTARVASGSSGGNIEIRLDSPTGILLGTCPVAGTGGWQTWTTDSCSVSGAKGVHNLYLKFTGSSGYLMNINWFKFKANDAFSTIEAESYSSMSGVNAETCSEGGQDIGYIENGDYIEFDNVDFGTGVKSFAARVASGTAGGNIEIRLDSPTGTLLGTCPVPGTGGWQTWVTQSCSVSGAKGVHNLYLKFTGSSGYLMNINWFKFKANDAFSTIEAESYSSMSGVNAETCSEGGQDIGYIENGDYIEFDNVDFGTGVKSFAARVASGTAGGNIEIRLDSPTGTLLGTCPVPGTGGWQTWVTQSCSVSGASGIHNLYLKFTGNSGYMLNLNWIKFGS